MSDLLNKFANLSSMQPIGDILEFGTGSGRSTVRIAEIVNNAGINIKRKIFTFDGFVGLPATNKIIPQDTDWQEGNLLFSEQKTRDLLSACKNVFIHKTMIGDIKTLKDYGIDKVASVNFDLDLYEGTRDALRLVDECKWQKIIFRFDDWGAYPFQDREQVAEHEQAAFYEFIEEKGYWWSFLDGTRDNHHSLQAIIIVLREEK